MRFPSCPSTWATSAWISPYRTTFRQHLSARVRTDCYDSTSLSNRRKFDAYELLNMKLQKMIVARDPFRVDVHLDL